MSDKWNVEDEEKLKMLNKEMEISKALGVPTGQYFGFHITVATGASERFVWAMSIDHVNLKLKKLKSKMKDTL